VQIFAAWTFCFGAIIGSFLNVVIARLPENRSVVHPPSHCPCCGSGIRPYDNIPILSWILLRGKCRDCQSPVSSLYPTIELLVGCLALLLFWKIFEQPSDLHLTNVCAFLAYLSFLSALVAQSFIDVKHYIIPDALSIYAAPFAIVAMAILEHLGSSHGIGWRASVLGAFFGAGGLGAVALLWWLLRRVEGMGMGDIKLLLLIGAMLGPWPAVPFVYVISACAALVVGVPIGFLSGRGWSMALPYGPFLAFASVLWLFWGDVVSVYWFPMMR